MKLSQAPLKSVPVRGILGASVALIPIVLCAVCLSLGGPSSAPAFAASQSLDARVRTEIAPFKGKVFLFAKNLDTGQSYSYHGDERVRTASTIKVAVMIEAFARIAEGRATWTDEL